MSATLFAPLDPLRRGHSVIEASAGTGKTFQITNLVLRLVAEAGVGIDELLVVTFTNAATAELRDRIRSRIGQAIATLEAVDAGDPLPDDEVLRSLASGGADERRPRLEALRLAREDFDAAAISTIHGFCRTVLQEHAFEAEVDLRAELVDGPGDALVEFVDDWIVRRLHGCTPEEASMLVALCGLGRDELLAIARTCAEAHGQRVLPERLEPNEDWAALATKGLQDFTERGEAAMIEAARRAGLASIYKLKKDGAPAASFRTRLDKLRDNLDAATGGWTKLASLGEKERFDLEELEEKWPGLDRATIPGLPALEALLGRIPGLCNDERVHFLRELRAELPRRMAQRNQRSFGDLLALVSQAVERHPDGELVQVLRRRYRAVLIDEFQDTDTTQWTIFDRVFAAARDEAGGPSHWLYLIGDPKQAIYAFRNADVFVYLEAKQTATHESTMGENHRSDGRLVDAMNALFHDEARVLEQPGLSYGRVTHAARNGWDTRLRAAGAPSPEAPLQLRWVDQTALAPSLPWPIKRKAVARQLVARSVAEDVAKLLSGGAGLTLGGAPGRPVHPGDVAILVRTHREADLVERALRRREIPAILSATESVFSSEEGADLLAWLRAIAEPNDARAARTLAVTPLGGFGPTAIAAIVESGSPDPTWTKWLALLGALARQVAREGFAEAFGGFLVERERLERIASLEGGERRLTNYRHLLEQLHAIATEQRLGLIGLARWLADRRAHEEKDEAAELRLESDARAVRVVTLHKSKGLQYPFVFVPFLWDHREVGKGDAVVRYHEGQRQVIDARVERPKAATKRAALEACWEELRLLYVGVTRAQHRVTLYWAAHLGTVKKPLLDAPLTSLLFGDAAGKDERRTEAAGRLVKAAFEGANWTPLTEALDTLVARGRSKDGTPTIGWSAARPPEADALDRPEPASALLPPHTFPARPLELDWRRASFSSLVASRQFAAAEGEVAGGGDPTRVRLSDEPVEELTDEQTHRSSDPAPDLPLAAFARGTEAGTFVHKVLELIDFPSRRERKGRRRDLRTLVFEEGPRHGIRAEEQLDLLLAQLPVVLDTPLGPGMPCLSQISAADRLDELSFDLALRGGDDFVGGEGAYISDLDFQRTFAAALEKDATPPGYIEAVREKGFAFDRLAGFLTGSLDLAFRVGTGDDQRWYVCDYKTNALHSEGVDGRRRSTQADFTPERMKLEMAKHHYYLQYHLYLIALRRLLRQRLGARFDPERHVGGVAYAFVRGMIGPRTPTDHAVFFHLPKAAALDALDALLVGEGAP